MEGFQVDRLIFAVKAAASTHSRLVTLTTPVQRFENN